MQAAAWGRRQFPPDRIFQHDPDYHTAFARHYRHRFVQAHDGGGGVTGARTAGAIAGALVAGIGLSALMMAGERKSGKPSELVELERSAVAKLDPDVPPIGGLADRDEQALTQGGHLLLSAIAGVAYAAATDDDTAVVPGGILFGLAFYGVAHWLAGPLLGVKQPEWRSDAGQIAMHTVNHLAFGLATAAGAKLAARAAA